MTTLLTFYFLSLSLLPCSDDLAGEGCSVETHFCTSSADDGTSDVDLCSPFCTCSCCHTHIVSQPLFADAAAIVPSYSNNSGYSEDIGIDYLNTILQPPRA